MNDTPRKNGIGIFGILTIILVLLKAFGYIDWSWFWVFAPLGIGYIIVFVFFVLAIIFTALNDK